VSKYEELMKMGKFPKDLLTVGKKDGKIRVRQEGTTERKENDNG
jgi:hypothetical protein